MTTTLSFSFKVNGTLTNPTSVVLCDPTVAFGVRRTDTSGIIAAANTAMTNVATGLYSYSFADPAPGITYEWWVTYVYNGITYREQRFSIANGSQLVSSITLADLRTMVRFGARNANDGTEYPAQQVDIAIKSAANEWIRLTRATRRLSQLALTIGTASAVGFPTNFLPEFLLEAYLTLNGFTVPPALTVGSIENALAGQATYCGNVTSTTQTSPPSGRPNILAFQDQTTAILDRLPDKAYGLNLWWVDRFTSFVAGTGSDTITFNLPDDHLEVIATGAIYYLQRMEPANMNGANAMHAEFIRQAALFKGRGAGGRGAMSILKTSPYAGNGDWLRGNN